MKMKMLAAATALTVLVLPTVGDAQSNRTSNQPIAFGADSGEQTAETISLRGRAEVTLVATVPAARLPLLGELSATEVRVTHAELVGAHEEVTPHASFDSRLTPCQEP